METMYVDKLTRVEGEWVWLPQAETFDLGKDFAMDDGNLNMEICRMGQLLVRYGTLAAEQGANLSRVEEQVKLTKASVSAARRSQAEVVGNKITIPELADQVTLHPTYQEALSELHILRADTLKAEHWWRSMIKKSDLLNAMAYRQTAELKRMPG